MNAGGWPQPPVAAEWLARARSLTAVLEAAAPRIEASSGLPADVLEALHAARMFRMLLPRSRDGGELDLASFFEAIHAIAEGDASTAWCVVQNSGCSLAAAYLPEAAAREIFDDRGAVLAWGFASVGQCQAIRAPGGWKVSGAWGFASGNRHATWLGGHCRIVDAAGKTQADAAGQPVERTMLFPRGAASIKPDSWQVVGLRGTGSDTYSVSELFVPETHSLVARAAGRDQVASEAGEEGEPERREKGTLYHFTSTHVYITGFSAVALGTARAMLDAFIALARTKTPVGHPRPLRDDPYIQAKIAACEARLRASRAWIVKTLRELWQESETTGRVSLDGRVELRLACTHAFHEARAVAEEAYAHAGATAIFQGQPFERRMRDLHAACQQIQGSAVHYQSVGQHFLGIRPSLRYL